MTPVSRRGAHGDCRLPPGGSSATNGSTRESRIVHERCSGAPKCELRGRPPMNSFRLAWRLLTRDWRAGELTVLIAALSLAVASVGTVAFFADRVKTALTRQANLLLGADVLVSGDRPLPDSLAAEAQRRGLAASPALK